ncbi:prepilin-type N-terminal cleavage/methylation domain-containing protein [Planctobacterium marinum]|uniref:Type IV fimbrial biogenesis protein PilW n=1 Tax=Planctobacterium marinum TaxID=1631968 RepID=A0AA48HPP1_9ALTE|nr:hypothetical protein MACH26_12200 [Planctobacterium marinum]
MLNFVSKRTYREQGATLVELMISISIGMVTVLGVASLVGMGVGVNGKLMTNSRLSEELKVVISLMERDIRRAGYNGATILRVEDPENTVSAFSNSITISEYTGEAANSCITFAYDANEDGTLDTGTDSEEYGYRLKDNAIEIRKNGAACDEDGWEDLTDSEVVKVTGLTFTSQTSTNNSITRTEIAINLVGELDSDADRSRSYDVAFLVRSYD